MQLMKDRTEEIKKELSELNQTLKMSVQKAIRIGQLLTEQKDFIGHGLFMAWIKSSLDISWDTVNRYINLFNYSDKISILPNLQEAYKQIETIEAQEKQSKEERNRVMIADYRKTGVKPSGWDRSLDYIIKKDSENIAKQKERVDNEFKEREINKKQRAASTKDFLTSALGEATDKLLSKHKERMDWKEKIRLSDGGKDDAFMDAIIDYMETLENDNRRIEACNNIIKICRNISVELQTKDTP